MPVDEEFYHRHRPLETRYGPAQTGPSLVPVQASLGRSGAGLNRSGPVGVGAAERPQETLYIFHQIYFKINYCYILEEI